jgi:hypothetical protein
MSEIVLWVVALGLKGIVILVLNLLPRPPRHRDRPDTGITDGMGWHPGIAVYFFAVPTGACNHVHCTDVNEIIISVWLVGHPCLAQTLERAPYAALAGRIQVWAQIKPVIERERFAQLIGHALKNAGCQHPLLTDSGMAYCGRRQKGCPGRLAAFYAPPCGSLCPKD